ncbi:uncharacterized protein FOMMEDRAFT_32493, partial [Fomitiporia mediterranea MF3/22]
MSHLSTHLPDVELVKPGNSYSGSLAVLYNETWRTQDPYAVFTLLDVVRDRPEIRADVETADKVCVFGLLVWIWSYFGRGWGEQTGYKPDPTMGDTLIFPPHNPFIGLNVVSAEQALKMGVATTGTPGNSVAITGTPGTSERIVSLSFWHCTNRQLRQKLVSFARVHKSEKMEPDLSFLPEHTWFLVDCNQYSKEMRVKSIWYDLFDFCEILEIRSVQLAPMLELKLQSFCNGYGPIAHPAFTLADDSDQHKTNIRDNLSNVGQKELQGIISNLSTGFFDTKFSHNTIVARPMDDDRTKYSCNFASNKVAQIVIEHFKHVEHIHALELYCLFLVSPKARAAAGYLLETITFSELQRGGCWRLQPMKKLPIGADKTKQYWGRHPGAPSFTLLTGHKGFSIKINKGFKTDYKPEDFAEVERIDYNPSDTLSETKPAMYIPRAPNNQAFDAWFYEPQSPEH